MNEIRFDPVWNRISKECKIKNITQLSKIIGVSQSNVSKKKKADNFPVEWAYEIAKKYNLLTEWILTGENQKKSGKNGGVVEDLRGGVRQKDVFLQEIENWLSELEKKEPGRRTWFKYDFLEKYPQFESWLERKKQERGKGDLSRKVA